MTIQKIQILLFTLLMFTQLSFTNGERTPASAGNTINKCDFRSEMRKLWEDHITWMRTYLTDSAGNLPSLNATKERLVKNQKDMSATVKTFFGEQASETIAKFLTNHITIIGDLIADLKKNDTETFNSDKKKLFLNNQQLAEFLNKLNPEYWPIEPVSFLLEDHLTLLLQQIDAHIKGQWAASIEAYEKIHEEALQISDAYAYGIYKKFPEKFAE